MFDIENLIEQTQELTLLYVEDNEDARESTLFILDDLFDNIIIAVDGKDGLEKFKNNKIDLVITDVSMPNMDGLEMSRAIKEIDNSLSIIILTALTNTSTIKEATEMGIDNFINKPIDDVDLLFDNLKKIVKKQ